MDLQLPNLRAEAVDEARRLSTARAYAYASGGAAHAPQPSQSGALVTRARHRGTRRCLAGRMLFIFRLSCSDGTGRIVAAHLIGVLCAPAASARDRRARDRVRDTIGAAVIAAETDVRRASEKWIEDAARLVSAFADARRRREHAIAERSRAAMPRPFQGGLFDRRAQRARMADAAVAAARENEERARLQMLEQSTAVQSGVELVLVLTP